MHHPVRWRPWVAALALALACGPMDGCAGQGSPETINGAYADQLGQARPGTDLATFKRLLPAARHFDTQFAGNERIDIYRLDHRYKPDELPAKQQTLYFFFKDNRLIRWGNAPW